MYITIILPVDFKFKIPKKRLVSRCNPQPVKPKVVTVVQKEEVAYHKPEPPRYCRADLL